MKSRQYASNPFTELVKKLSFFFSVDYTSQQQRHQTMNSKLNSVAHLALFSVLCMYVCTDSMHGWHATANFYFMLSPSSRPHTTSICLQHAFTVSLFILLRNCKERLEGEHQPDDLCQIQEQKHHLVACMYIYTEKNVGINHNPFLTFLSDLNPLCGFTAVTT